MKDTERFLPPILAALVVAILPQVGRLPFWIIFWCAGMWGYLFLSLHYRLPRPNRFMRSVLTLLGILGLLATFRTEIGPNAYVGLLSVMAAVKPFEIRNHRDRMITAFLAYFIVVTCLLQSESLAITIYMFLSVLVTTAALIRINDPDGEFRGHLGLSARIIGQAIPLMVILFLLFPRIQGSLFGLSRAGVGKTGFSDMLSPGSITRLTENATVAFRAEFKGPIPSPDLLYWRGIVFTHFDGRTWLRDNPAARRITPVSGKNPVEYTVTLEPHDNKWLFALDLPAEAPPMAELDTNHILSTRRRVSRTLRYTMRSYTDPVEERVKAPGADLTRLPEAGNQQARELAETLVRDANGAEAAAECILDYFRNNRFVYSLEPPALGSDPVDAFLFRSKSGYCEHYASAFAFMMRATGIPARIVGGYLGGEINPYGGYLIVRQSDAHVWVEIWDRRKGWIRVDPTSAVAPERISGGLENGFLLDEQVGDYFGRAYNHLKFGWDSISLKWETWFSGYSHEEQMAFLERFGIDTESWAGPVKVVLLMLLLVILFAGGYILVQFFVDRPKPDPVKRLYGIFCKKLASAELPKQAGQGPRDFAEYVIGKRPDLRDNVSEITNCYIELRYAPRPDCENLARLRAAVRKFDPSCNPADGFFVD